MGRDIIYYVEKDRVLGSVGQCEDRRDQREISERTAHVSLWLPMGVQQTECCHQGRQFMRQTILQ
jgi:hypothetical protein